jgi:hypothetical protein
VHRRRESQLAFVAEGRQQLLDEQGVALGHLDDLWHHIIGDEPAGQPVDNQPFAVVGGQWF